MMEQPKTVDIEAYLVLEPKWATGYYRTDSEGRALLEGGRIAKVTQSRPTVGKAGGVVTKVKFRVDAGVFLPLQPEAVIHITAGNAETIEVEALDPREESTDG